MIYYIRHGESESNEKKIFAGQKDDSILTQKGKEQARATAQEIRAQGILVDRIVASPLKRALETAEIIAEEIGFDKSKIIKDARIIEYDLGTLSGAPWNPIINLAEAENAEDPYLFRDRILSCVNDFSKLEGNTLFCGHGIVGRMLKCLRDNKDPKTFNQMPTLENASVLKIDWI